MHQGSAFSVSAVRELRRLRWSEPPKRILQPPGPRALTSVTSAGLPGGLKRATFIAKRGGLSVTGRSPASPESLDLRRGYEASFPPNHWQVNDSNKGSNGPGPSSEVPSKFPRMVG